MIPRSPPSWQTRSWQHELARAVRDPAELCALLDLPLDRLPALLTAAKPFSLRVPRGFVARMRKGDPHDPLLRQVLPAGEELLPASGYTADPVGDLAALARPGVLHKYHGRVLLVTTGACAVHCRYCFRRHFPYNESGPTGSEWHEALDYIAADASIHEVILSGGDPLMLPDARLAQLAAALADIPHLKRLRVHSRLPVVLPERIDAELLDWLGAARWQASVVIHANHPQEIDASVAAALRTLRHHGITLLNQSVLLAGVNDDADDLAELSERLFECGVLPYYLHTLDRVTGAAHFAVDGPRALALIEALRTRLPGYLVPRLVVERPGGCYKQPLG